MHPRPRTHPKVELTLSHSLLISFAYSLLLHIQRTSTPQLSPQLDSSHVRTYLRTSDPNRIPTYENEPSKYSPAQAKKARSHHPNLRMSSPRPPSYHSYDSIDEPVSSSTGPGRQSQSRQKQGLPAFRQRKSSTIISISSGSSSGSVAEDTAFASGSHSTSTSPARSLRTLQPSPQREDELNLNTDTGNNDDIQENPMPRGTIARSPIPPSMRAERKSSDSDFSLAEEGEATPLMGSDDDGTVAGKWYTGPLFVTGVKLAVLFMIFTAVLVGTFYWGIPALDPEDKAILKLPRSFEDLQNLKSVLNTPWKLYNV